MDNPLNPIISQHSSSFLSPDFGGRNSANKTLSATIESENEDDFGFAKNNEWHIHLGEVRQKQLLQQQQFRQQQRRQQQGIHEQDCDFLQLKIMAPSLPNNNGRIGNVDPSGHHQGEVPVRPPQPHLADSLIAQQLSSLSMQERERVYYDVHGVREEVEETPELLQSSIDRLVNIELPKLQQRHRAHAYSLAVNRDQGYVHRTDFLLKFLRAELFDPVAAALRLTRHFETKLDLFGPDKLARDITQDDDLDDPDDVATLYGGQSQILPVRDRAGRVVTFWTALSPSFGAWGPHKSKLRRQFYFCQVMSEDVETQKKGIVAVYVCHTNGEYTNNRNNDGNTSSNDGAPPRKFPFDTTYAWKAAMIARSQPIRCEAVHVTMEEPKSGWGPLFDTVKIALTPFLRVRIKTHFGTYAQCRYALQTFGIPAQEFPILEVHWTAEEAGEGGEAGTMLVLQTDQHVDMMSKQRERERREKAYWRAQQAAEAAPTFWNQFPHQLQQHDHQNTTSMILSDDNYHLISSMDDSLMPVPIDESRLMRVDEGTMDSSMGNATMDCSMGSLFRPTTPNAPVAVTTVSNFATAMVSAGSQNDKPVIHIVDVPPVCPYHLVTPPTPRNDSKVSSPALDGTSGLVGKAGARKRCKASPVIPTKHASLSKPPKTSSQSPAASPSTLSDRKLSGAPSSHGMRVGVPSRNDVLFGRGKGFQNHIGNQKYRQMIEDCQDTYEQANKEQKTRIAEEIIDIIILQAKGRFLRDMDGSGWRIVSDPVLLRQKVAHSFRGLRDKRDKERNVAEIGAAKKLQRRSKTSKQPCRDSPPPATVLSSTSSTMVTKQRSRQESDLSSSDDDYQEKYTEAIHSSPRATNKRSKSSVA